LKRALALLWLSSRIAWAGGGAATDAYDDIRERAALDVHGLLDLYLAHNFAEPASGVNELRQFDAHADQAALGYLRVTLAHHPRRVGFRLDVGAGDIADSYRAEDPAVVSHPELARVTSYVGQAFVTVLLPLGREIQLDAGKFATPVGLEDNESLPNWNYSRSLLFSWAEPTLHTGVRLTCKVVPELALSLFWVNGWNSVLVGGNGMRAAAGAATWKPIDALELVLVYMGGLERPPTNLGGPLSFRNLVDTYIIWRISPRLAVAATVDYGNDRGAAWWGVSGYARAQALPWLAVALRGEYYADPKGFTTGTAQRLAELTATVELRGEVRRLRMVARLEWRHDQSTARVFDGAVKATLPTQDTLTLALLAAF
jgi:hypothetical protein